MKATVFKYLVIGKEVGEEGTHHLQGYIVFKDTKRLSAVKKINARAHWEQSKGTTTDNYNYCSKDGIFEEFGIRPKDRREQALDQKERWADVIRSAEEGTTKDEYPSEYFRYHNTVMKLRKHNLADIPVYGGYWYTGPPGTGKSRFARSNFPGLYVKLHGKWWDDYNGEETVLLDDLSLSAGDPKWRIGDYLKQWTDHYPFRAEVKGGTIMARPKNIVITSNYTIEEIFGSDEQLVMALKRRFKVVNFPSADFPA